MARATVFEAVQFGVESPYGTAAVPSKQALAMSIEPTPSIDVRTFRPRGNKHTTVTAKGKDYTTAKLSGLGTYTEILYPFAAHLCTPSGATAGTGKAWTFSPSATGEDTLSSLTVEAGSNTQRASRFTYGLVNKLGYTITRDEFSLEGSMMGQKYLDDRVRYLYLTGSPTGGTFTITVGANTTSGLAQNSAAAAVQSALVGLASVGAGNAAVTGTTLPTGPLVIVFADTVDLTTVSVSGASLTGGTSPTAVITRLAPTTTALSLTPIVPEHISVYADTASGSLGGTKLTGLTEFKFNSERFDMFWPINSALSSYREHVETPITGKVSLKGEATGAYMNFLQGLRAGTTYFLRVEGIDPIVYDVGHNSTFRHDIAIKVTNPGELSDESGVLTAPFEADIVYDGAWGKAQQLYIKNTVTAL